MGRAMPTLTLKNLGTISYNEHTEYLTEQVWTSETQKETYTLLYM